jgi:hypothetical protein
VESTFRFDVEIWDIVLRVAVVSTGGSTVWTCVVVWGWLVGYGLSLFGGIGIIHLASSWRYFAVNVAIIFFKSEFHQVPIVSLEGTTS